MQSLRDRGDHRLRWLGSALALETCVIVGGHVGEHRDFFAAQAVGAATWTSGQTDVFGLECLAAQPQELGESRSVNVHYPFLQVGVAASHGSSIRG